MSITVNLFKNQLLLKYKIQNKLPIVHIVTFFNRQKKHVKPSNSEVSFMSATALSFR